MSNAIVTTRDTQLEKQRTGDLVLSLTEFNTTSEPKIAAGSVVEIGGSLFVVTVDEAITGWAGIGNDTNCYIKLVPGVADFDAEFTTDVPTWSASKQGWYDGVDRFIGGLRRGASDADYESKWVYQRSQDNNDTHRITGAGDLGVDGSITKGKGLVPSHIYHESGGTQDGLFHAIAPAVPIVGDLAVATGIIQHATSSLLLCSYVERTSATALIFYGVVVTDVGGDNWITSNKTITDGGGAMGDCSIVA